MLNSEVPLRVPSGGPKRPVLLTLLFFDSGDSLERRRFELRGERVGLPASEAEADCEMLSTLELLVIEPCGSIQRSTLSLLQCVELLATYYETALRTLWRDYHLDLFLSLDCYLALGYDLCLLTPC